MMDCKIPTAYPKPLCILFFNTKGIQWVDTNATDCQPAAGQLKGTLPQVQLLVPRKPREKVLSTSLHGDNHVQSETVATKEVLRWT